MPSAFTHAFVAASLAPWFVRAPRAGRLLAAGVACSVLPDADSLGFAWGIPYGSVFGHRGLTHSIAFALALAAGTTWWLVRRWGDGPGAARIASYLFLCTVSHGVLDAMTSGGLGIGFLAPFSNRRFFFPWRPIQVSPISVVGFFNGPWLAILRSEMKWVWLPAGAVAVLGIVVRRVMRRADRGTTREAGAGA